MHEGVPPVSVVIPCRNEEGFIDDCLKAMIAQDYSGNVQIIIAEGGSTDGTLLKLLNWQERCQNIKVIENPEKIVSTGLNRAIREADGDVIVRVDVHSVYARDYISSCVNALLETGADNVGGPWRAKGRGLVQNAIAMGFQSTFSSGGARSHAVDFEGSVDSVYLGCWHKSRLLELGLFDEKLIRNQDDELNFRITQAGGTIWQSPVVRSWYFPRPSLVGLFRQYFQYGYWKIRVMQKHRRPASLRHIVPIAALILGLVLLMLGIFQPLAWSLFLICAGMYLTMSLIASVHACLKSGIWRALPIMPLVFLLFHVGYAAGSLKGIFDFVMLRRGSSQSMKQLTR